MVGTAIFGGLSLVVIAVSLAALYEQRLYTPEQREQAQTLYRLRGFLWILTTGLGVVSFGLVVTSDAGILVDYVFSFALVGLVLAFVERQFHRAIDTDRSPLAQQFEDWWSHPSDR